MLHEAAVKFLDMRGETSYDLFKSRSTKAINSTLKTNAMKMKKLLRVIRTMADESEQMYLSEFDSSKIASKSEWSENLQRIVEEKLEKLKSDYHKEGWIKPVRNKKRKQESNDPEFIPGNLTLSVFNTHAKKYCKQYLQVDIGADSDT